MECVGDVIEEDGGLMTKRSDIREGRRFSSRCLG